MISHVYTLLYPYMLDTVQSKAYDAAAYMDCVLKLFQGDLTFHLSFLRDCSAFFHLYRMIKDCGG